MLSLRRFKRRRSTSLEREVIGATFLLYVLVCAMLLAFHYLAPRPAPGAPTSSSTSPAHGDRS
jgi:hypothetical protein